VNHSAAAGQDRACRDECLRPENNRVHNGVVKGCRRTFLIAPLFVVLITSCSGDIDGVLAERHTITHGAFKGFLIGEEKEQALTRVQLFGIRGKAWTIAVSNGGASVDDGAIMRSDSWEVETTESPHGVLYDLHFVDGRLIEIKYTRPRFQVN
jgi:hypothetical protein